MKEKDIIYPQKGNSPEGGALHYVTKSNSHGKFSGLEGKVYAVHPGVGTTSDLPTKFQG